MIERFDHVKGLRERLEAARCAGGTVGFVPTLGALHAGHAALLRRAVAESTCAVLSVFVNPLQFGEGEDYEAYPRGLEADLALAVSLGVAFALTPSVEEMYPQAPVTSVDVGEVTRGLEGDRRPGHFRGVATVVAKLLSIVGPCRAYFGEKDWQQLQLVRRMVADLSLPVEVVACPVVRDEHGVALSSRLAYLDADQRRAARVVYDALRTGREARLAGGDPLEAATAVVEDEPLAGLRYVAERDGRLHVAVDIGPVCLIDNVDLSPP